MIWKNSEGYYDPTAGEALSRIIRDERRKRRAERETDTKGKGTAPETAPADECPTVAAEAEIRNRKHTPHHDSGRH